MTLTPPTPLSLQDAYQACASITRTEAGNFYYGIRLLPADKRAALCAVYALARRIDDIGDGALPVADKLTALDTVRREVATLSTSTDPVLAAVADTARRMPIPVAAFDELIDGVESDVCGQSYATFDDLVLYCRRVAGSIGRLCLGVFGSRPDPHAASYADALGIALQQTNILRDVREDLAAGRVYLPMGDLDRFGVTLSLDHRGDLTDPDASLTALIRFAADRAQSWYAEGLALVPLLDRRSAACVRAMSGIYRTLLRHIQADPSAMFDQRLSLSGWRKAGVAARALTGVTR